MLHTRSRTTAPTARRRRPVTTAALALAGLVVVAGCSMSGNADEARPAAGPAAATTPTTAPTPTPTPVDDITRARVLAAQYDYAGAEKLLAGSQAPEAAAELTTVKAAAAKAVPFADNSTIPHIFYHSLVVDPSKAFHSTTQAQGYMDYMVTLREFKAQLEQLHKRGFVLVHASDIARKNAKGEMAFTPIVLPPGKTPLVMSIDDTSYYEYMTGEGFATKLVAQPDGQVLNEYVDASGATKVGSYDVMPVVDDFVREHPDFSYHGHKGTMALTGYNGVLGYRTSIREYKDTPTTRSEIEKAKVVAEAMKKNGWLFASHTWGHINATTSSLGRIQSDAQLWDAEVRPILGTTDQLIFAFGADISGMEKYTDANPKYHFLHTVEGFDYIFPIDASTTHWMQLSGGSLRQARINIDGISMGAALRNNGGKVLSHFFDVKTVIDPARPNPAAERKPSH